MDENNGPKLKNEQKKGHKVKIDQKNFLVIFIPLIFEVNT